jgi:hypothetical protein
MPAIGLIAQNDEEVTASQVSHLMGREVAF